MARARERPVQPRRHPPAVCPQSPFSSSQSPHAQLCQRCPNEPEVEAPVVRLADVRHAAVRKDEPADGPGCVRRLEGVARPLRVERVRVDCDGLGRKAKVLYEVGRRRQPLGELARLAILNGDALVARRSGLGGPDGPLVRRVRLLDIDEGDGRAARSAPRKGDEVAQAYTGGEEGG